MEKQQKSAKEFLLGAFIAAIAIGAVSLYWRTNLFLTAILLVETAAAMYLFGKKEDVFFFLGGFAGGPIAEIIAVSTGAWKYSNPTFLGIPLWLPFLWGMAVFLIRRIVLSILQLVSRL